MVGCFSPCCVSGYDGLQTHAFRPHTDVAEEWVKILLKIRADKKFDPLNKNHRLCFHHFEENVIIKEDKFVINGENVHLPRKQWRLTAGAIPTIFPNLPSYRQIQKTKTRKVRKFGEPQQEISLLQKLQNNFTCVIDWKLFSTTVGGIKCLQISRGEEKIVEVFEDSKVKIYFHRKEVTDIIADKYPPVFQNFSLDLERVKLFLHEIKSLQLCQGISSYDSVSTLRKGCKRNGIWFSQQCYEITKQMVCTQCKLLYPSLGQKLIAMNKMKAKNYRANIKARVKITDMRNKIKRCKTAIKTNTKLKMLIKRMKISLKHVNVVSVEDFLSSSNISHSFASALKHAIKMAKLKSTKGMRYEMDWLLECLLLRIKSPGAYKHIFSSKLLPVPHPSTLRRLISGQECQFGFNSTSLKSIELEMSNKPQSERQGSLIFDEIKLRETLNFNKGTKKLDGYIDYGEYTDEIVNIRDKKSLADHALVIMYRPLRSNWVQPIASFGTKGAAKGNALQKIIVEAVIKLESVGAQVVNVVADGAKTNKNFWKRLGISGKVGNVKNKITHPFDETRQLFFLCDVPHLIKCVRNHFRKYGIVKYNGKSINFQFYEKLLLEDNKRQCGLRKCPKLTKSHINPNSFEKMTVSLATQLFSRSVATGIQFYRLQNVAGFENSEDTESFTLEINNLFDALNGRFCYEGIKSNSAQLSRLKNWLDLLDDSHSNVRNTFASTETLSALRITLKSVIEITEYLLTALNFEYVLTNKLNQDPCEKFFGLVRGAGGHEDHPTVSNFLQLYRILSLYTPTKKILKGNITPGGNETVLVAFQDSLKSNAKAVANRKKEWKDEANNILQSKLSEFSSSLEGCPTLDANIVYYLSGYVVAKSKKFTSCQPCLNALQSSNIDNLPGVADLSKIMDYGSSLKYPSVHLFKLLCFVIEPALVKMITSGDMYGDIVINILSSLSQFSVKDIGCGEGNHNFQLICKIVPFYIVTRLYFYVRAIRNDLGHGKATKNKRKMSKLHSK